MITKKKKERKFAKKLLHKYRLVILNQDTFEERFSIKLTRLNVFVIVSLSAILLVAGTTFIIAFTSLREFIPGYSSAKLKRQTTELYYRTDSLQQVIAMNDKYISSIRMVLSGEVGSVDFNRDSINEMVRKEEISYDLSPSEMDRALREKVDKEDKYNLFEVATAGSNFVLFPPVNGEISEGYNIKERHYAVDIVVARNTPVKSTADGTVIFAEWSAETGYVIIIEHSQSLISVYKHNDSLTKAQGDLVKAGEVVAMAGSSGELSTGPHLHFELWNHGYPINPTNFIDFN